MSDLDEDRSRRDAWLSLRLAEGDGSALEEIYDLYSRPLFRQAVALLGSVPDAEDALQNVFFKLARRQGGPVKDLGAYLFSSVRNEAISLMRQRSRVTLTGEEEYLLPSTPVRVEAERSALLEEALLSLPMDQREAIVLRIYEGMTFEEIGRRVKASAHTVASRYRYGLKKLRHLLGDATHAR